jgi:cobalt-zinc-cadmium efflux system outer membrane protein
MSFPRPRLASALVVLSLARQPLLTQRPAPVVPPSARPTMDEVVSYALRANPDLITARLQVDSARGEQGIARALPNPTFSVTPSNPYQYTVNEPIDVGPNRLYRTRAASQGTAAVRLDVQNTTRQVVFSARQGFLDLLLAEAARNVVAEQDTIVRRLLQSDSLRLREGDIALRDLSTTELQYAHAESNLAHAEAAARAARINLQVIMGVLHPDTSFRVSGSLQYRALDLPVDSLKAIALATRPDIAAARVRTDQSRSLKSLTNSLLVPVPGLAAVYQNQPFENGSNYALGLSLSVPVVYWFSGERQKAAAGLQSAEVASKRTIANAESDVVAASDNFRASRTLAERYAAGLLDKARAALEMQRFAYEHGSASLLDLLNAISAFGDTQTDYYTAVHDYWVAAYSIDRAVGRDLVP